MRIILSMFIFCNLLFLYNHSNSVIQEESIWHGEETSLNYAEKSK